MKVRENRGNIKRETWYKILIEEYLPENTLKILDRNILLNSILLNILEILHGKRGIKRVRQYSFDEPP